MSEVESVYTCRECPEKCEIFDKWRKGICATREALRNAPNPNEKASPSEKCSCGHVHVGCRGCSGHGLVGKPCSKCRATCLVDSDDPEEFECLWRPITTGTAQQESRP